MNPAAEAGIREHLRHLARLRKILEGLVEFADIRDREDAGDWVVVTQIADMVNRNLGDTMANVYDALKEEENGTATD